MNKLQHKREQIKSASFGISGLLLIPQYFLLAAVTSLIFALVIFFAINANFYGPLMMSQLPFLDKIALLGAMLSDIFTQGFTSINGALLIVVSVLQGISIAAVIFTAKKTLRLKFLLLLGWGYCLSDAQEGFYSSEVNGS